MLTDPKNYSTMEALLMAADSSDESDREDDLPHVPTSAPIPSPTPPQQQAKVPVAVLAPASKLSHRKSEKRAQNESVLQPLLSAWDSVEKYLDGDAKLRSAQTCSTAHEKLREAEGYTRFSLPHILGYQAREPICYESRHAQQQNQQCVKVKHAFMVLLMRPTDTSAEVRKVQLHFTFDYPVGVEQQRRSGFTRIRPLFYIKAYRYSTKDDSKKWKEIELDPFNHPVTALLKQAIDMCCQEMKQMKLQFPHCNRQFQVRLRRIMNEYCENTLTLEAFQRRAEEAIARRRQRRYENYGGGAKK